VGDDNGVVWIWDPLASLQVAEQNVTLLALSAAGSLVNGLAFNKDGSLLAAAYRSSGVVVWRVSKPEPELVCRLRLIGEQGHGAYGVAFHQSVLAIAGGDKAVHLWDVSKSQCPEIEKNVAFTRNDVVFGVAISNDGNMLAAASGDGSVAVWNINNPAIALLDEHFGRPMFAVAFSQDGKALAATGDDGIGYFWDIQDSSEGIKIKRRSTELSKNVPEPDRGKLGQISFSRDEKKVVATAFANGAAVATDAHTLQQDALLRTDKRSLFGVAFTPDSRNLLVTSPLSGSASLVSVGDSVPIETMDRSKLLQIGFRRLTETTLSSDECKILRSTQIPVFEKSFPNDPSCSLPLLAFQKLTLQIRF
jgi:WD40 repeat protein